ncbi:MAG: DUF962 domain-containing protein [Gammaproteobacteria bacterium]|nr:DUF962 domain-containing protein [Gammaproteobacteria bacterium]MBV9696360.1 DUF962 domain-containing protein [Gammaproteobacteria bacterium]
MSAPSGADGGYASFAQFYPFYLSQHRNRVSRRLHLAGTALALLILAAALVMRRWTLLPVALLAGYLPAWSGHFFFERNTPATFRHPLYSLRGDLTLLADVLSGRQRW